MEVRILSLNGHRQRAAGSEAVESLQSSTSAAVSNANASTTLDSQQPVDSNQQADVLGWQADGRQDQQHGYQSGAGNAGSSNTGQGGGHTEEEEGHFSAEATSA